MNIELENMMEIHEAFYRYDRILHTLTKKRASKEFVAEAFRDIHPNLLNDTVYNVIRETLIGLGHLPIPSYPPTSDSFYYDTEMVNLSEGVKNGFVTGDRNYIIFPNEVPCPIKFCPFYKQNCVLKYMVSSSKNCDYSRLEHPCSKICHFIDHWYGSVQKQRKWLYITFRSKSVEQIKKTLCPSDVRMGFLIENEGMKPMLQYWSHFTIEAMLQVHYQLLSEPYLWVDIMLRLLLQSSKKIAEKTEIWKNVLESSISITSYEYLKELSDYLLSNKIIFRHTLDKIPSSTCSGTGIFIKELDNDEKYNLAHGIIGLTSSNFNECSRLSKPQKFQGDRNVTVDILINDFLRKEQYITHDISRIQHKVFHVHCYTKVGLFHKWTYQHLVGRSSDELSKFLDKNTIVKLVLIFDSNVAKQWEETDI